MRIGQVAPFPSRLTPMPARLVGEPLSHADWLFEPKLDGFRAIAFLRYGGVRLVSRNGNDLTERYPGIVSQLESMSDGPLVLDGEIVAPNDKGDGEVRSVVFVEVNTGKPALTTRERRVRAAILDRRVAWEELRPSA